jgi:hypothetical protein
MLKVKMDHTHARKENLRLMQTRSLIGMQVLQSNPTKNFAPTKDSDLVAQLETKTFSNCALKRTDLSTFLSQFFFNSLFFEPFLLLLFFNL